MDNQFETDLQRLKDACQEMEKSISRRIRKSTLDHSDSGTHLSREYRKRVHGVMRDIESIGCSMIVQSSVQGGVLNFYEQYSGKLNAIWAEFESDYARAKKLHNTWRDSLTSVSVGPESQWAHWNAEDGTQPLMAKQVKRERARMSMPPMPSQTLSKGVPFEPQFDHIPRRSEPPKKKKGFFSLSSSDTSDSDQDARRSLRPPVMWVPM